MTTENKSFTIDDFDALDTATMQIITPGSGDGSGQVLGSIVFAGPGHQRTIALSDQMTRRRLHEEAQQRANRGWKPQQRTPDELARENVQFVVNRIIDWQGIRRRNGDGTAHEIPFDPTAGMDLLLDPKRGWLFAQCVDFLTAQDSFFRRNAQ